MFHVPCSAFPQLECELSEVQAVCRKAARTWEDGLTPGSDGSGDRGDNPADVTRDPGLENQIVSKLEALKERLRRWQRRLEE